MVPDGHMNDLGLGVKFEAVVAALAPDAAFLHPAEGNAQVAHVVGVDPHHPRLEGLRHAVGPRQVVRPHVGGQPVAHAVGEANRLLLIGKGHHRQDGAEDLLLPHAHVRPHAEQERRRDEVPAGQMVGHGAGDHLGPLLPRQADVPEHPLAVIRMDERPHLGARVEGIAEADAPQAFLEARHHLLIQRLFDKKPGPRRAALAVEGEDAEHRGVQGALNVGVGKQQHRRFAAEFHGHAFQRCRPVLHDRLARRRLAGEGDKLNTRMGHERRAGRLAEAVHKVEHPRRQPASSMISASFTAVKGDHSAGFSTTVLPQARAGAIFHVASMSGAFHGVMSPATPTGRRTV